MPFNRVVSGGIALAVGCLLVFSAPVAAGPKVAAVQVALKRIGLYSATVDGVRGPLTKAAIVHFQRRRGLAVDGVVGPQTRARVRQARPSGVRLADDEARRPRLGRRRDAVHPRPARLPAGRDRRGVRADDRHGAEELPARLRAGGGRARRSADHLRASARPGIEGAPGTTPVASGPVRLLRPVPRPDRRRLRRAARGRPHAHRARLPGAVRDAHRRRGRRRRRVRGLELGRLREPRGRPAQARLHHLVRPHVRASRCPWARA